MAKKQHLILVSMPTLHEIVVRAGSNFWPEVPHLCYTQSCMTQATENIGRGRGHLSLKVSWMRNKMCLFYLIIKFFSTFFIGIMVSLDFA